MADFQNFEVDPTSIFSHSIKALTDKLALRFQLQSVKPLVIYSDVETVTGKAFLQSGKISLPFIVVGLSTLELNRSSYNVEIMKRQATILAEDDTFYYALTGVPVVASFRIRFITDSYKDLNQFMEKWMLSNNELNFYLRYKSLDIGITVDIETSLQVPPKGEMDSGMEYYQLETSGRLNTYVGKVFSIRKTKQISVNAKIPFYEKDVLNVVDDFTVELKGS